MDFNERLIKRAKYAIQQEKLPKPKIIRVYERKKFSKSYEGQYGETDVREGKNGKITSVKSLFVRRNPTKNVKLSNEHVAQAMAHELSHLKYKNHTKSRLSYSKKLYRKYLKS